MISFAALSNHGAWEIAQLPHGKSKVEPDEARRVHLTDRVPLG